MYLNGMLVSWNCNKQALVSLSTMDSEFISAARGVQEVMGCYYLVKELGMNMQYPMKLRMDNQAAITCIINEASSSKTKHVDIKHKYIKDLIQDEIILPSYIPLKCGPISQPRLCLDLRSLRLRTMIEINPPTCHDGKIRGGVLNKMV
jgi:hypothetical protein